MTTHFYGKCVLVLSQTDWKVSALFRELFEVGAVVAEEAEIN
jgi:hypothetical protein